MRSNNTRYDVLSLPPLLISRLHVSVQVITSVVSHHTSHYMRPPFLPTPGLLKSALQSDGKFTKPVVDLQGHPKKVHDAAAMAAVFPPIAKPLRPSSLLATADVTAEETEESATTAAAAAHASSGLDIDEMKRQQRLEQNKMSARRSRRRKKIILEELQTTVDQLTAENEQLEEENKRLEEELERRKKAAEKGGSGGGRVSTTGTTATTTTGRPAPSAVPSSFITGSGLSNGTGLPIVRPSTNNRSLLVSQIATIMNGQAAPGLLPQTTPGASILAGPAGLTATSIISSIATPAPRPSQLYLSRPTVNANANTSQAAAAQEQLHRSILSMYQEQERKNANKKRRLENQPSN